MSVIHAQPFASKSLPVIVADPDVFAADFARRAFRFDHTLAGSPRLAAGARAAERGALLEQVLAEVTAQAGLAPRDITQSFTRLITLPPRARSQISVTRQACFLLQIQGERRATTWDGRDRAVLSDLQLERLHARGETHAQLPRAADHKANVFALGAGSGLHLPPHTPHWMEAGATETRALLIEIGTATTDRAALLYRANHRLRRLGLRPAAPGQAPWRDSLVSALGLGRR